MSSACERMSGVNNLISRVYHGPFPASSVHSTCRPLWHRLLDRECPKIALLFEFSSDRDNKGIKALVSLYRSRPDPPLRPSDPHDSGASSRDVKNAV